MTVQSSSHAGPELWIVQLSECTLSIRHHYDRCKWVNVVVSNYIKLQQSNPIQNWHDSRKCISGLQETPFKTNHITPSVLKVCCLTRPINKHCYIFGKLSPSLEFVWLEHNQIVENSLSWRYVATRLRLQAGAGIRCLLMRSMLAAKLFVVGNVPCNAIV